MKSALALFVVLLALWLLSSGHYTPLITSFGVLSCAGVVLLARSMRIADEEAVPVHLVGRALRYSFWFAVEVVKANIDVALRILRPGTVKPLVFDAPTSQKTDLGRVLYANSITMTPGTVSIVVDDDRILVHAIAAEPADGVLSGEMDRRVTEMEGCA